MRTFPPTATPEMYRPKFSPHSADPSPEVFRERYDRQMAYLRERLKVPNATDIYTVNEERLAVRPRLHFGSMTVADLRRRAADPRFVETTARVHEIAARFSGSVPPEVIVQNAHDPNRPFADSLAWMAMSVLLAGDDAGRERTLAGLRRWIAAFRAWGPFTTNLSLAQSTIGLSQVYDWLHDILSPAELASLRSMIIERVRLSLDENMGGLTMWRGQRFAANHNWAHHSARAYAAWALWGETEPALKPGELKFWLDDALEDFWIVKHTHSNDGAPMEGGCYQDYGLRFFADFCGNAESLLHLREPFFDEEIRKLSARISVLLPGGKGSMIYADAVASDWWGSCSCFRALASHFQDSRLQLMGDLMANCGDPRALPSWRDLFCYDPDLAPARLEDLPLFRDMADFGLYTARSDWGKDAAFFGLRCGPASAESVVGRLGFDFGEAHIYPNHGDFNFYIWSQAIIPGCEYASKKLTRNHNLVVFAGRDAQAGRDVGQVGEGGGWFNALAQTDPDADYDQRQRAARVVAVKHGADYHHYRCDLGGLYRLRDERVPGGVFFPDYRRDLVFLPDGAVAVVDRIQLPVPRTFSFRLLTAVEELLTDEHGFRFTVWGVPSRIDDFSPTAFTRNVTTEALTTRAQSQIKVASLRAEEVSEAVFAVVLGVGPAAGRYRIATDGQGYTLTDTAGVELLRTGWPQTPA